MHILRKETFGEKLNRWAMIAMAGLLAGLALTVLVTGSYNPPAVQTTAISPDEAVEQCGGAPVTRTERHESQGSVQIYRCPNGSEILALQ